jgi:hypothetical protein
VETVRGEDEISTHVTASYSPVRNLDVTGVPDVRTVGIDSRPPCSRGGVHIEVGHGDVVRVRNESVPIIQYNESRGPWK